MSGPRTCAGALVLGASLAAHSEAVAEEARREPARAIELTAFGGYALHLRDPDERGRQLSAWNGGGALAGGVLFRSPYLVRVLSPFVDVGYYPLHRSRALVTLDATPVSVTSSLATLGATFGLAADLGRLRVQAGLALYDMRVESTVLGSTIRPRELDGGYLFAVGADVVKSRRLSVGAQLRLGLVVEADAPFVALGSTVTGSAISW